VAEAGRCLDCDLLCSTCETVCPNRAIFTYRSAERVLELPVLRWHAASRWSPVRSGSRSGSRTRSRWIADLCNDCGNCTTFCPTSGRPFADKPRLFLDEASFQAQTDNAFRLVRHGGGWIVQAALDGVRHELEIADPLRYRTGGVELRLASDTLEVLGTRLNGEAPVDPISLRPCSTMLALFHGVRVSVPWIRPQTPRPPAERSPIPLPYPFPFPNRVHQMIGRPCHPEIQGRRLAAGSSVPGTGTGTGTCTALRTTS